MNLLDIQERIEKNSGLLIFGILLIASLGGLAQILPVMFEPTLSQPTGNTRPHTALELAGRDVYIRESCSLCHSQQVRPLLSETLRYGPPSVPGEFAYDRPFLWGSKRTGPDLHRVGGKYSDEWHRVHLLDPRSVVPASIMPAYPWLAERPADATDIRRKLAVLRALGHPYSDEEIEQAEAALDGKTEMDAVIAYLQSLGGGAP